MIKNQKVDMVKAVGSYKEEIYQMLICLGCNKRTSAALMRKNEDRIKGWFGSNKGPIVTAQMSARLILRSEQEGTAFTKNGQ